MSNSEDRCSSEARHVANSVDRCSAAAHRAFGEYCVLGGLSMVGAHWVFEARTWGALWSIEPVRTKPPSKRPKIKHPVNPSNRERMKKAFKFTQSVKQGLIRLQDFVNKLDMLRIVRTRNDKVEILLVSCSDLSQELWIQTKFKYPTPFLLLPGLYQSADQKGRKSVNTSHNDEPTRFGSLLLGVLILLVTTFSIHPIFPKDQELTIQR